MQAGLGSARQGDRARTQMSRQDMLRGRLRVGDDVQQRDHGLDFGMYQIWSEAREESSRLPSARVCDFSAEIFSYLGQK